MKRREILSVALFVAILAGFVWALSLYFLPKDNTAEAGIQDVRPNGFLSEPENSLDYVILGGQHPSGRHQPPGDLEKLGLYRL